MLIAVESNTPARPNTAGRTSEAKPEPTVGRKPEPETLAAEKLELHRPVSAFRRRESRSQLLVVLLSVFIALTLILGGVFCVLFAGSTTGLIYGARVFFEKVFNPLNHGFREILLVAGLLALLGLGRGVGDFLGRYFIEWVGNRVVMDLRNAVFGRLQDLSLGYFTGSRTGELISRLSNDTALVERAVAQVLADLVRQPVLLQKPLIGICGSDRFRCIRLIRVILAPNPGRTV
jgi:ABC-type multidrug transport system fused ATPase/permease subunit